MSDADLMLALLLRPGNRVWGQPPRLRVVSRDAILLAQRDSEGVWRGLDAPSCTLSAEQEAQVLALPKFDK